MKFFSRRVRRASGPASALSARAGRAPSARPSAPSMVEALEARKLMAADLALSGLSIDEASASAGAEIHTNFTYTNLGDSFEGAWNIELRLSTDEIWGNADDVALGVEREDDDLESGESSQEGESVIIPSGVAAGTYRLAVFIDSSNEIAENSESNNIAFSTGTITVTSGGGGGGGGSGLNIAASDVSVTEEDDDEIEVAYTYTNTGAAFNGFFDQEFRLSLDTVWGNGDDILLGVEREIEDLLSGQSSAESESWDLPSGLAAGDYYVGVMLDSTGVIEETDETDNLAWSATTIALGGSGGGGGGGPVDLTLQSVVANPTPRPPGEDIDFGWTIVNAGGSFDGAFDQEVRLSLDTIWGNGDDIVLGVEREDEDFDGGETSTETESFDIPLGTPEGTYYVAVRIDSSEEVTESDETNNIAFSAEPMAVVGSGGGSTGSRGYAVYGDDRAIDDDDVSPRRDDDTAFNRLRVDGRVREHTYTIRNYGSDDLSFEDVRILGRNVRDFAISRGPDDVVAPGGVTTIVVRFDPTRGGARVARLEIDTDRDGDDTYEFKLKGTGLIPAGSSDATVRGRSDQEIRDDDLNPGGGDGTRFNTLLVGESQERTFTLFNDGAGTLTLVTPLIRLSGTGAAAFSIVSMPAASIAPGASTTFTIRFTPITAAKYAANVEILSNDPDEGVYNFRIVGRGE